MAKPYSLDLRQKVIDAIELDGMKKSEASAVFGLSRNTIDLWLKRKAATGSLAPQVNSRARHQQRITDWEGFRAFAEQHRHKTQTEMAECWPGAMSQRTISRALRVIDWTRKSGATPRRRTALGNAHQDKDLRLPSARRAKAAGVHSSSSRA